MLTKLLILALLGIIFLLFFGAVSWMLQFFADRNTLRNRLKQGMNRTLSAEAVNHHGKRRLGLGRSRLIQALTRHLTQLLHSLQIPMKGDYLLCLLLILAACGLLFGYWIFESIQGMLLSGCMLGLLPYLVLRLLLVQRRLEAQIDFLPALEAFYQCYLITGERQIKVALARLIEEKRMTGTMKRVFEQLYRNLSVLEKDEESLQLFAHALGHIWADYFVQMLNVAMSEGVSISGSLRELIGDMRAARRSNEQERHRLLEIRIANFTPILFLALFMGINFYYNREQSVYYYFHDAGGRELLLHMTVMIFLSFLMGLYLSRKKL